MLINKYMECQTEPLRGCCLHDVVLAQGLSCCVARSNSCNPGNTPLPEKWKWRAKLSNLCILPNSLSVHQNWTPSHHDHAFPPQSCLISFVKEPHGQHVCTQSSFCVYLDTTRASALTSCRVVAYIIISSLASWLLLSLILLLFNRAERLFRVPCRLPCACTPPLKVITQNACFP